MSSPKVGRPLDNGDEQFDELVLMSKNHTAGPPVLDGSEMPFGVPNTGLSDSSSHFPNNCSGLDEVTEPALLSFLTGDMGAIQDQLSLPSFLGDNFQHHQLGQSPGRDSALTLTGTILSSTRREGRGGGEKSCTEIEQLGQEEQELAEIAKEVDMAVDCELLGDLSNSVIDRMKSEGEDSSGRSSAGPACLSAKSGSRIRDGSAVNAMRFNAKGKGVQKAGSGADRSLYMLSKSSNTAVLSSVADDKENGGGQQSTRLRYSKGAAPSKYCHVCGRSAKTVSVALCGNNKLGLCRKVVCDKCLIMHQWGDFRSAKEAESSWTCTHCRGDCPPRARCHQYQRNNMRRRLKSSSNLSAVASGAAGATGASGSSRPIVSRQGIPLSGAAAASAAQHSARMAMRPVPSVAAVAGAALSKLGSAEGCKGSAAADETTPTNIIGAAGVVFQTDSPEAGLAAMPWLAGGAAGGSFEDDNFCSDFNFLE
jgi:hypothetical protein